MEKQKKILIIGPFPDPITGNSLANSVLYQGIKENGLSVSYINSATKFSEELGKFSFSKLLLNLKTYFYCYKIFFSSTVYITPGQTFFGVIKYAPFISISKLLRKKVILHIHGNYIHQEYMHLSFVRKKIYHFVLSLADKGIVLSTTLRKNLAPFFDESDIYVVSNFVQEAILKHQVHKQFKELRILYLSNLMTEKGIFDLLDALLLLKNQAVPYKVKIAGNIASGLKERIDLKLRAIGTAEYMGVVRGKKKLDLLEWGNVFVLPTFYPTEGQPISILEAMARGNIVLTTDQGGIPDIFSEKNGYFIEKKNSRNIADRLSELYKLFKSRTEIIKNISNENITFAKKFTEEKFVNNVLQLMN